MLEAGVLHEDEPLELIEGRLIVGTPQGPAHSGTITRLQPRLQDVYGGHYLIRTQLPLDSGDDSLPEPDFAIVETDPEDYTTRHPRGSEALLVIEIASTSQELDAAKAQIYARAGVPVYWLLDLTARRLVVYGSPQPDGTYGTVTQLTESQGVGLPNVEQEWPIASLLPRSV